jgi:hypothetical protein
MVANYVFKDVFNFYKEQGGTLDYKLFREVTVRFNSAVMDQMIYDGRTLDMGSGLSTLSVVKSDIDYARQRINWGESHKLKAKLEAEGKPLFSNENPEGHKWLVYYTFDSFIHFYWCKSRCRVDNKKVYRFNATRGETGNKTKLKAHLNANPLAHTRYDRID